MLKFTSMALGLLTVIAMAPSSQAANVTGSTILNPVGELHAEGFRREMRQERREIRRHRQAIRRDRREIRHDRREMRHHY